MTDAADRKELVSALRNQTELGRLNESVILSIFDKIQDMGWIIEKKPEPKPIVGPMPMPPIPEPPQPEPVPPRRAPTKHK